MKKTEHYELRLYDVFTFINTPYERRDEGYLVLGAYMDGQNSESAKMNQTQPVVMRYEPATVLTHHASLCHHTILKLLDARCTYELQYCHVALQDINLATDCALLLST